MVLLDLSCSFDSLRHDILILRLEMIGINGIAFKWLNPYIINRELNSVISFLTPPSTVWRPTRCCPILLFSICITLIRYINIIISHFPGVIYHIYADNIQLYSFLPTPAPDNSQLIACAPLLNTGLSIIIFY